MKEKPIDDRATRDDQDDDTFSVADRRHWAVDEEEGDVSEALDDLRHTTAALASHIDAITANLEDAIRNANEFSKQIREDPSVLLRGREVEQ